MPGPSQGCLGWRNDGGIMLTCADVLSVILTGGPRALDEASKHIAACPRCRQNLAKLLTDIGSENQDVMPCAECSARLPQYLASTPGEIQANDELRSVREHLQFCGACRTEYEDLLDGAFDSLPADLSKARRNIPTWRRVAADLFRLPVRLPLLSWDGLRGVASQFAGPSLVLVRAGSASREPGGDEDAEGAHGLEISCPPDMGLTLRMSVATRDDYLLLLVEPLLNADRSTALGASVGLYLPTGDVGETCLIDESQPIARFTQLAQDTDYLLRVQHNGAICEIPLDLDP